MSYLDLFLDDTVLFIAGVVLVRQAPLVASEHGPWLEDAIDLAVHSLPMIRPTRVRTPMQHFWSAASER